MVPLQASSPDRGRTSRLRSSRKFAPLAWVLLPLRFSHPCRGEGFLVLRTPREANGGHRMTNDHADHSVNHSRDEAAVRALYQELMDGWNLGSGDAFAAVFTEDGDLMGCDGTHFKGRQEIAPFHQQLFDKWLKGSRLVGEVKDVRFLSPDVALMHALGGTVLRGRSEPRSRPSSPRAKRAVNGASLRSRTLAYGPWAATHPRS